MKEGEVGLGENVVRYTLSREDTEAVSFNLCGRAGDEFVNEAICCSY